MAGPWCVHRHRRFLVGILLFISFWTISTAVEERMETCGGTIDLRLMTSTRVHSGILKVEMPRDFSRYQGKTTNEQYCDITILFEGGINLQIELYYLDIMPVSNDVKACSTGLIVMGGDGEEVYGGRLCREGWRWEKEHREKKQEKKVVKSSPLVFRLISDGPFKGTGFKVHYNKFRPQWPCASHLEFKCDRLQRCVHDDLTCDGWDDCGDDSDEDEDAGCELLTVSEIFAVIIGVLYFVGIVAITAVFVIRYRKVWQQLQMEKKETKMALEEERLSMREPSLVFPHRVNSMESVNRSHYSRSHKMDVESLMDRMELDKADKFSCKDNMSERSYRSNAARRNRMASQNSMAKEKSGMLGSSNPNMVDGEGEKRQRGRAGREEDRESERRRRRNSDEEDEEYDRRSRRSRDRRRNEDDDDDDDSDRDRRRRRRSRSRYDSEDEEDSDRERRRRRRRSRSRYDSEEDEESDRDRRRRRRYDDSDDDYDRDSVRRRRRRSRDRRRYDSDDDYDSEGERKRRSRRNLDEEEGDNDSDKESSGRRRRRQRRYDSDDDYDSDRDRRRRRSRDRRSRDLSSEKLDKVKPSGNSSSQDKLNTTPPPPKSTPSDNGDKRPEPNTKQLEPEKSQQTPPFKQQPSHDRDRPLTDPNQRYTTPPRPAADPNRQYTTPHRPQPAQPVQERPVQRAPPQPKQEVEDKPMSSPPPPPSSSLHNNPQRYQRRPPRSNGVSPSAAPPSNGAAWVPRSERKKNRRSRGDPAPPQGDDDQQDVYEDVVPKIHLENLGFREEAV